MTVLDAPAAPAEMTTFPPLDRATDRCEGVTVVADGVRNTCGAQAFQRAVLIKDGQKALDLVFCNHHGNQNEPSLIAAGFVMVDESGKINTKPTDPSQHQV